MSTQLLDTFESIAYEPEAVPRLRAFILQLAVGGKLTSPLKEDEPAAQLRRRILAEAASQSSSRRKGAGQISQEAPDQAPLDVPPSWAWVRLVDMAQVTYGFAFPSGQFNERRTGMPLIRIRDISRADTEAYYEGEYDPAYLVEAGNYLVGMDGDFNLRNWQGPVGLLNQRVTRIKDWRCGILGDFLRIPLQMVLDQLHEQTSLSTVKHLSAKQVNAIFLPLPPLAEQQRIVAKVDELMALCNELEAAQTEREDRRDRLVMASLARVAQARLDGDESAFRESASFYLNRLPQLSTRPEHVAALRRSILDLAVHGRLVQQEASDESGGDLLARIGIEKEELVRRGELRKTRRIAVESVDNPAGGLLPPSWASTTLGQVTHKITDGAHHTPTYVETGVPFVSVKDFSGGQLDFSNTRFISQEEHLELFRRCDPRRNDILIGRIGTLGRAVVVETDREFSLFVSVALIRANAQMLDPTYLSIYLNSPTASREFDRIKVGGGTHTNKLNLNDLHAVYLPLPPFAEQGRIVREVQRLIGLTRELDDSLETARKHKQVLLGVSMREALPTSSN